jgi:hypothetical protein
MSKASKRILSAKRTLARSVAADVRRRSWTLVGMGLLVAAALIAVGLLQYLLAGAPEPLSSEAEKAIRNFSYALVIPFAKSAGVVLPTFVAALLALAVLEATQFGAATITQIVVFIGWLAAAWGWVAGFAFFVGELGAADTLAAAVLALVCVLVAAVIVEVLPLGAEVRANESDYRQQRVRASFNALRAGWERRTGTPLDLSRSRPNREVLIVVGWYGTTLLVAAGVVGVTIAAAGPEREDWLTLLLVYPLLPMVMLVFFHINALQLARLRPAGLVWFDPDGSVYVSRWLIFALLAVYLVLFAGVAVVASMLAINGKENFGGAGIALLVLNLIPVLFWLASYLPVFRGPRWTWLLGSAAVVAHLRFQKTRLRTFKKVRKANKVLATVSRSRP